MKEDDDIPWGLHVLNAEKKAGIVPILEAALQLLKADEAYLLSVDAGQIHVEIARGPRPDPITPFASLIDFGPVSNSILERKSLILSVSPKAGKGPETPDCSILLYPLDRLTEHGQFELLFLRGPSSPPFGDQDKKITDSIKNIILAEISFTPNEKGNLSDEARTAITILERTLEGQSDLERLCDVAISLAAGVTEASRGYLFLYESSGSMSVKSSFFAESLEKWEFNVSNEFLEEVARSRAVVAKDSVQVQFGHDQPSRLHALLGGPLLSDRGELLGQLYLSRDVGKGPFSEADRRFLGDYCSRISKPLMNALSPTAESIGTKIFGRRPRFKYSYDNIIGVSPPVQNLYELLDRIVETDHSVIIQGESGTGKELVANAIHFNGPRKNKPFIAENCAALSDSLLEAELFGYVKGAFTGADRDRKGFFEIANGGTLFLDEIGEMNIKMQKDLLRVLQEGEVRPVGGKKFITVDVRIICASNKDLRKLVSEGKFREDLYYRLDVMTIRVPSLRERKEDIPLLVEHFLSLISKETNTPRKKIGPGLVEALQRYDWPGNIRELKNELKRMLAICKGDTIQVTDFQYHDKLPILMNRGANGEQEVLTLDEMERRHILKVLDLVNGNKAKAAEVLGINRATIFRKIKKYDIEA